MKIKNPIIVILAVILINLSACSPVLYSTVGQNVPLFREKGEVSVNGGLAVSGNSNYFGTTGFNAQVAVAATKSLAIISSVYALEENDGSGGGSYFELGIGKYKYSPTSKLTGEIFLGSGFGSIKNYPEGNGSEIKSNFLKVFIQPSGGWTTKIVDFALTPRIAVVHMISGENDGYDQNINRFLSEKKTTVVFEPGVTLRLGFKYVKLQYQFNYSTFKYNGVKDNASTATSDFDPVNEMFMSFNLSFIICDRWGKIN